MNSLHPTRYTLQATYQNSTYFDSFSLIPKILVIEWNVSRRKYDFTPVSVGSLARKEQNLWHFFVSSCEYNIWISNSVETIVSSYFFHFISKIYRYCKNIFCAISTVPIYTFYIRFMVDGKMISYISCLVNERYFFCLCRLSTCKITIYLWNLFFVTYQTPNPFAKEVNLLDILLICITSNYILDDLTFWFQRRLRTIFSAQIKFKK